MARFKLQNAQYLDIEGSFFEQRLTSSTGRPIIEKWPCHRYLDPKEPNDCNHTEKVLIGGRREEQPFVVITTDPNDDIEYKVRPGFTPNHDMTPMDEEAKAMLAKVPRGFNPIESLPTTGLPGLPQADSSAALLAPMMQLITQMQAQQLEMVKTIAELQARRTVEDNSGYDDPLPEPEPPTEEELAEEPADA